MSGLLSGNANKFLVSVLGAVATSLAAFYGGQAWEPMAFAIVTAVATYIVPNLPKK